MRIIKEVLDTGLTVILAPMSGTKTVTAAFACRAGWKYEALANDGIAHFLEHMAFRGTSKRPTSLEISKEIDGKGGIMNAATSEEITIYLIKLPYQHTSIACDVLSDILLNSLFLPEEIEKEKGTVIQELRRYHDDPSTYVGFVSWPKLLYGDQPAGKNGVGTEESIRGITREHFIDFLRWLYVTKNSAFCLAGKIRFPSDTFELISNYFKNIISGEPKISKPPVIENQKEPALLLEARDIQQSHLILGARSYNIFHPKKYSLIVLSIILGGHSSSRLCVEIRDKRGLAYYVGSFYDMQSDTGSFGINAGIAREKILEAVRIICDEYKKICEEKVSEEELSRAKDYLLGISQMALESSDVVAYRLARQFALGGKADSFSQIEKKIKAVTAEDVQSVAQEIFVNKGLNLAIVGPHQGMEEEFLKLLRF